MSAQINSSSNPVDSAKNYIREKTRNNTRQGWGDLEALIENIGAYNIVAMRNNFPGISINTFRQLMEEMRPREVSLPARSRTRRTAPAPAHAPPPQPVVIPPIVNVPPPPAEFDLNLDDLDENIDALLNDPYFNYNNDEGGGGGGDGGGGANGGGGNNPAHFPPQWRVYKRLRIRRDPITNEIIQNLHVPVSQSYVNPDLTKLPRNRDQYQHLNTRQCGRVEWVPGYWRCRPANK